MNTDILVYNMNWFSIPLKSLFYDNSVHCIAWQTDMQAQSNTDEYLPEGDFFCHGSPKKWPEVRSDKSLNILHRIFDIWTFKHLNIWTFKHLNIGILVYLNIWTFEHLNIWIFENLNIWTLEHLNIETFVHLYIEKFEHLNIWTFEHLNICIFEHLKPSEIATFTKN